MMWDKYTIAKYSMLLASHTDFAPWTIIRSDHKKSARISCIKHILTQIEYPDRIKKSRLETDKKILLGGNQEIKNMERDMSLKKNSVMS